MKGGASRAVHQVSDARQKVRVAVAAGANPVPPKPGDGETAVGNWLTGSS